MQPAPPLMMQHAVSPPGQEMQQGAPGWAPRLLLQSQQLTPPQPPGQEPVSAKGRRVFGKGVAIAPTFPVRARHLWGERS
jgi:hypothetical protein